MRRYLRLATPALLLILAHVVAGCETGPAVTGSFDRTFSVRGPIRLELTNASGDVQITGSSNGKVHVHGDVRASGMGFDKPQQRLNEVVSDPPVEQRAETIRVGKELSHLRNVDIFYTIEVPQQTEVNVTVASGAQTIRAVRGPVKVQAASGSIRVAQIEGYTQLSTASGSINASDVGDDIHANSASGSIDISKAKGDVRANALMGVIQITQPGGRVEAETANGSINVQGAAKDVKAHAASGSVVIQGNPGADSYWDLKTISGGVQLTVPSKSNFHLTAEALSGEIRTDIPIVIEEQDKHSLRAHVGQAGGRVEIHTVSGEIHLGPSN